TRRAPWSPCSGPPQGRKQEGRRAPPAPDDDSAPVCSYRLQLLPHLDFAGARRLVPYLRRLGVSHLYLAPSMQARRGSTHGYDVVDPTEGSEELRAEEELRQPPQ